MFRSIWQRLRGVYTQKRSGIDLANIEHQRADLRFRLAMVEYAYYGRSGKRVARCLAELQSVIGDKAVHRYLRTLDPDLRTQFVERFQGLRRSAGQKPEVLLQSSAPGRTDTRRAGAPKPDRNLSPSNVVPIHYAVRRAEGSDTGAPAVAASQPKPSSQSRDSSD
jgi:hypothetical protein